MAASALGSAFVLFSAPANDPFPENKQAASLAHLTDTVGWREGFGRVRFGSSISRPTLFVPPGCLLPGFAALWASCFLLVVLWSCR